MGSLALRLLALAALLFVSFAGAGALLGPPPGVGPGASPRAGVLALVALCVLDALVLGLWILRAEVGGARLSAAMLAVRFPLTLPSRETASSPAIPGTTPGQEEP